MRHGRQKQLDRTCHMCQDIRRGPRSPSHCEYFSSSVREESSSLERTSCSLVGCYRYLVRGSGRRLVAGAPRQVSGARFHSTFEAANEDSRSALATKECDDEEAHTAATRAG